MKLQESLEEKINETQTTLARLLHTKEVLASLTLPEYENYFVSSYSVDLDNPTREQFDELRRAFPAEAGNKWTRAKSGMDGLNYTMEYKDVLFRAWNTPPPPSCKVTYEEVYVPGHVERKAVIDCKPESND